MTCYPLGLVDNGVPNADKQASILVLSCTRCMHYLCCSSICLVLVRLWPSMFKEPIVHLVIASIIICSSLHSNGSLLLMTPATLFS